MTASVVLYLNPSMQANPLAGVPCIKGGAMRPGDLLSWSIQLLHLDQACVEYFE